MAWVRVPAYSFLITSSTFVVFILDMASPGYGKFAFIPDLRPLAILNTDVRADLENLVRSTTSPIPKTKKQSMQNQANSKNCQTLLDAYKPGAKCHFEPTNYSNTSP
ncbi:hypothetical protein NIES4071_41620 [Calothrix sp. NIES-4071]|nr:hypothetical protein NIES4071_41620 [Calothrix sp. NIES-4071]BAZ58478.1 hypothetical protein NIES4105_41560 [Calothrix sp. NIES-4105]